MTNQSTIDKLLELFWEKTSSFQREPKNWETLLCGQLLEPYARRMFSFKTGLRVIELPYMYQHPDHPFCLLYTSPSPRDRG